MLDVTGVTLGTLSTLNGSLLGADDELVIGSFAAATPNPIAVNNFESVVATNATSTAYGTTFVLDTNTNSLAMGAKSLQFNGNMNTLSFGGTAFDVTGVPHATTGVTVSMVGNEAVRIVGGDGADSITTNGGADIIRGGAGNDTLNGGFTAAVGPKLVVTMNGGAATFTAAADNITMRRDADCCCCSGAVQQRLDHQ